MELDYVDPITYSPGNLEGDAAWLRTRYTMNAAMGPTASASASASWWASSAFGLVLCYPYFLSRNESFPVFGIPGTVLGTSLGASGFFK